MDSSNSLEESESFKESYGSYITTLGRLYHDSRKRKDYLRLLLSQMRLDKAVTECGVE